MNGRTKAALAMWGMRDAHCTFVAGRENEVYKVTHGYSSYALRFKRPGYRDLEELKSELHWLAAMDKAGLNVARPIRSRNGNLLEEIDGHCIDLLIWLEGKLLGHTQQPLDLKEAIPAFSKLGAEMARFHLACDSWAPSEGFRRCRWDIDGLLGDKPVWGRFWENPTLTPETKSLFEEFRSCAYRRLSGLELDFGLIHADLVRENVLYDGDAIRFIDFDDGGYGYRLFDVATALLKYSKQPHFSAIKEALIDGYLKVRSLDMHHLELFLALRATTYVGWVVPRMEETGAKDRNIRFTEGAKELCSHYLKATAPT